MTHHAKELPFELWQQVIDIVCDGGRAMCEMSTREMMCSLQQTCQVFYDICTPIIYRHAYILSEHGWKSYLANTTPKRQYGIKVLMIFANPGCIEEENIELNLASMEKFCCLPSAIPASLRRNLLNVIEWTGTPYWSPETVHSMFPRLRRVCLGGIQQPNFFTHLGSFLSLTTLDQIIVLRPELKHLDATFLARELAEPILKRRCSPHVTILNGLAKTIDNPGFSRIQRSNSFFDALAREPAFAEFTIHRLSLDVEEMSCVSGDDVSPFAQFVEESLTDGTIWRYCQAEGRICGQSTGLGLAVVPY